MDQLRSGNSLDDNISRLDEADENLPFTTRTYLAFVLVAQYVLDLAPSLSQVG